MSKVLEPWHAVEASDKDGVCDVNVWGRRYRHAQSALPVSVISQGRELLHAPIRLRGTSNGKPIEWNEEGCYLMTPTEDKATVNGYAQSDCLILNTTFSCEYDGAARWDLKILPRGITVPQNFGLEPSPIKKWGLERLWLEIPLKKDASKLYMLTRFSHVKDNDGTPLKTVGAVPPGGMHSSFTPMLWLGDDQVGLQLITESSENWQCAEPDFVYELKECGDYRLLRINLLDSTPQRWCPDPGISSPAICFRLGMIASPIKPFDNSFLQYNVLHIDCFTKIKGDYWPFLNGPVSPDNPEHVIDRLSRAGVNLLVLHEKWNKIQNYWKTPLSTEREITALVKLCHSRGIKVIPYFGYEISSAMPEFADVCEEVSQTTKPDSFTSGWYRVPWQRASRVCYNSFWADKFLNGMLACIEHFDFDGVYLDGTTNPAPCANKRHGCGYLAPDGNTHPTYPVFACRKLMRNIYAAIHARHGIVNPHISGLQNLFINGFSDMVWDGEHIQSDIQQNGITSFPLEYFRAEYTGRNLGIPVQFIVYEFPGIWNFDMALSLCLIHGIYPRPNAIHHPLDVMERIWKITGAYGIANAQFHGYWESNTRATADNDAVKVSYYSRTTASGTTELLLYAANPTASDLTNVTISINGKIISAHDAVNGQSITSMTFPFQHFETRILNITLDK